MKTGFADFISQSTLNTNRHPTFTSIFRFTTRPSCPRKIKVGSTVFALTTSDSVPDAASERQRHRDVQKEQDDDGDHEEDGGRQLINWKLLQSPPSLTTTSGAPD